MEAYQVLFSNEVVLEDERVMRLDYSLTQKLSQTENSFPYYGARITKYLDKRTETEEICGISESMDNVISLIKKLCHFQVTPISMVEIVDDLITQGI